MSKKSREKIGTQFYRLTKEEIKQWYRDKLLTTAGYLLAMLLYRDEYYHPDTIDRGVAEVIVAKNRGGPTGVVTLLFDAQFTCFKNLAR